MHRAAVQLHQGARQRQADPQAAVGGRGQAGLALREQVEDLVHLVGRDAAAVVE
jgi:hypothetical protein